MKKALRRRNKILLSSMQIIDERINSLQKELEDSLNAFYNRQVENLDWKTKQKIVKSIHGLCDEHDVLRWEFGRNKARLSIFIKTFNKKKKKD